MKIALAIIAAIVVIGGAGYALFRGNNDKTPTSSAASTSKTPTVKHQPPTATGADFTINANDENANLKTLDVKKGDAITVKFNVEENEVYHGGLEFKSDVVNSQPIKPGSSDTVSFTADKSFDFTPYWYQSSIKKDYLIHVQVQ